MSSTFRIVGFAGCVREESYNKAALHVAQDLLPADAEMEILTIADLPSFTSTAGQFESQAVSDFTARIRQADAVLIMTPEYKGMLPNALKNALSWAAPALSEKPIAIMGIGRQTGAEHELQQLRQLLVNSNALVLEEPEVYISLDAYNGSSSNTAQQIQSLLKALVAHEKAAVLVG